MFKAIATVFIAHFTAYTLVAFLPTTGIVILGIGAADPNVLENYRAQFDIPDSYQKAFIQLISWDFGKTLDGVSVSSTLYTGLAQSMPILAISFSLIITAILFALFWPRVISGNITRGLLEFATFLPAFLPAFLLFILVVLSGTVLILQQSLLTVAILGICVGFTPCCLAILTIHNGFQLENTERYVHFMRACGFGKNDIYRNTRKAVLLYSISSWEKLLTLQIAVLIFTEAVFSYPGFGSALVRALQRTDVNLLLASIVSISIAVATLRVIGTLTYILLEPRDKGAFVQ